MTLDARDTYADISYSSIPAQQDTNETRFVLYLIVLMALVIRLAVALPHDALAVYRGGGGDEAWYLANGYGFVSGQSHGLARGISFDVETQPGAVAYLILIGAPQKLFDDATAVRLIWVAQAMMGAGLCIFAYGITRQMTHSTRAGLLAAFAMALHPSFVLVSSYILTENLFLFLVGGATWIYVEQISGLGLAGRPLRGLLSSALLVGLICGAAVLTRGVFIVFPLLFALHLVWYGWRRSRGRAIGLAIILLVAYILMTLTWTAFLWVNYGRFVVASTQFMPAVWRGVVTTDTSPQAMDAALQPNCVSNCSKGASTEVYTQQVSEAVKANPVGVLAVRAREWLEAVLTPYPTADLGGESLRALVQNWTQQGQSVEGFERLIRGDNFGLKLLLYLAHYGGIIFGLMGLWAARRRAAVTPIVMGFLLYTYAIHLVGIAIPRYIFPTQLYWWCAAAAGPWAITAPRHIIREDANGRPD